MDIGDLTLWQWLAAAASAVLVGLSKAGFGSGAAMLAVPLMAAALGPVTMLAVMLLVLIAGDVFSIIHYLDKHDRRNLAMLVPGLVIGVGVGYLALGWFLGLSDGELWMKRVIGFSCAAFVLVQLYRTVEQVRSGVPAPPYRPAAWHGVGLGVFAGITSTLAHAGGPLIDIFLLPQKLEKRVFVGTIIRYFFIGNVIKLIPYYCQGLLTRQAGLLGLALLPCVVVGTLSGVYLNKKVSDRAFRLVVYVLAFCMGLHLLIGWEPWRDSGAREQQERNSPGEADAPALFESGLAAYGRGDYEAAASAFGSAAAAEGPWQDSARLNRAVSLYQAGRYADADTGLEPLAASADAPVRLQAAFNRGNNAYRMDRPARAADWYLLTVQACRAQQVGEEAGADADAVRELLRRAEHNLALARARSAAVAKAEANDAHGTAQRPMISSGSMATDAAPEGPGSPRRPDAARGSTGNAPGSDAGARDIDAVLAGVASRDTGPVLKGRSVRVLPGGPNW